jgi:hypothetical protein
MSAAINQANGQLAQRRGERLICRRHEEAGVLHFSESLMKTFAVAALVLGFAALSAQAFAGERRDRPCADCPPAKKYDSREVIKTTRDVDRSRVIETTTVVPVSRRIHETNHLVVHENETRNVGVIQHNHVIVEKEIRYVRPAPIVVNEVVQHYVVVHRPARYQTVYPVHRPLHRCRHHRHHHAPGHHGSCHRALHSRG